MRPNVVFALVIAVAVGFVGGQVLGDTKLTARVQALETRLGRAEGTLSGLDFYVSGQRHETRIGLLEAKVADNTVNIRDHERRLNSLVSFEAKMKIADMLLREGQREMAQTIAVSAVAELVGASCERLPVIVPTSVMPEAVRTAFFQQGSPYRAQIIDTSSGLFSYYRLAITTTKGC